MVILVLPPEAKKSLQQNASICILDVRTPKEFEKGHLENAIHLNFYAVDFPERVGKLSRDKAYLIYCHSGARALKTEEMMEKLGFDKVMVVKGNIASKNN